MTWAVPDVELERVLRDMVNPIASITPGEQLPYFRGWERLARQPYRDGFYNYQKLAGKAMGIASTVWSEYPPQSATPVRGMADGAPEAAGLLDGPAASAEI